MKTFLIKAEYTFEVTRELKASNYQEAVQQVKDNCGCVHPQYHSSLPYSEIDWQGTAHPVRKNYSKSKETSLYS